MKKIKLSVVALTITMSSYGQCTSNPVVDDLQEQNYKIDQVIDAIRMDMYYGHLERQRGMYYVNELIAIKRDNEINIVLLTNKEK
tara:strand:- start:378 stop:632 length:255 start_codon:yes stop_codon:yes gene_type:complete